MTEAETMRALLIEHLERRLGKAQAVTEREVAKLIESMAEEKSRALLYVLEWSDSLFAAAAEADVLERVHGALVAKDSKATFETLKAHALDQALGKASRGQSSSSGTHNLVDRYTAAAWCEVAQLLRDIERGWV